MNKNYLTQVVFLFLLTIAILLGLSILKPTDISFTTKEMDILGSLRNAPFIEEMPEEVLPAITGSMDVTEENDGTISVAGDESVSTEGDALVMTDAGNGYVASDTIASVEKLDSIVVRSAIEAPRKIGDITLIEDYTMAQAGLKNLETAIANMESLQRPVRIAVLGDSFTEADILTQDVRQLLQDMYGGCGVGYMPMYSDCPGFRRSISHVCKGWDTHSVVSKPQYKNTSLTMQLNRPQDSVATVTRFKGLNKFRHIDTWEVSKIGLVANRGAAVSVKTDSGRQSFNLPPDEKAQFIVIPETTQTLEIICNQSHVAFWGAWLDGNKGIAVDNISIRGNSGITIPNIPVERLKQLNEAVPYDLLILQYGLNCMDKRITDYTYYKTQLVKTIRHLRTALPNTDIIVMGISDRCQNIGGTIQTIKSVYAFSKAQRSAAIETGCHFWDCCEAMKTLGGMETFVKNRWANKDYTHISFIGGTYIAEEFVKALKYAFEKKSAPVVQTQNETVIYE